MKHHALTDIIFVDIETVSQQPTFDQLDEEWQSLWTEKVNRQLQPGISPAEFYPQRAAILAEFGKVICISTGFFLNNDEDSFRVRSFHAPDEREVLSSFVQFLQSIETPRPWYFCGHNIREFDIPYLCRRLLANRIPLPGSLDFQSKKPWETNLIDTFQYWRFGDYKNYTSLNLLAKVLDVPSPKNEIDGSKVGSLYWEADPAQQQLNMKKIIEYCERDVAASANIFLKLLVK